MTFLSVLAVHALWPEQSLTTEPADAVVCLGAGMSRRGWELPDDRSLQRALTCAALVDAGTVPIAVFTGYGHEVSSAAAAMARAARAAGVADRAIIEEEQALSTLQNAAFSRSLLPTDVRSVIVVSDAYHLPRAWLAFRVMGFQDVRLQGVPEQLEVSPPRMGILFRESIAVWYNAARIAVYWAGGLAGIDHDARVAWFD